MPVVITSLRLPPDVNAFIEAEAAENASSKNSEIVRAIRLAMRGKGGSSPPRLLNKSGTDEARAV